MGYPGVMLLPVATPIAATPSLPVFAIPFNLSRRILADNIPRNIIPRFETPAGFMVGIGGNKDSLFNRPIQIRGIYYHGSGGYGGPKSSTDIYIQDAEHISALINGMIYGITCSPPKGQLLEGAQNLRRGDEVIIQGSWNGVLRLDSITLYNCSLIHPS
jgi:hypothetical protein